MTLYGISWISNEGRFIFFEFVNYHTDSSVQGCSISSANALETMQSCTEPSIYMDPMATVNWTETISFQISDVALDPESAMDKNVKCRQSNESGNKVSIFSIMVRKYHADLYNGYGTVIINIWQFLEFAGSSTVPIAHFGKQFKHPPWHKGLIGPTLPI